MSIQSSNQKNVSNFNQALPLHIANLTCVRAGMIAADLPVYLIERPYPFATLDKLWQLSNSKERFAAELIEPWLAIEYLEDSWKKVLAKKVMQG